MSAPAIPELPPVEVAANPDAAVRALDTARSEDRELSSLLSVDAGQQSGAAGKAAAVNGGSDSVRRRRGRPPKTARADAVAGESQPSAAGGAAEGSEPEKLSARAIRRLPKSKRAALAVRLWEEKRELESQLAKSEAERAAASIMTTEESDAALGAVIGEVVDVVDSVTQVAVGHERLAAAVAWDSDEKRRVVLHGTRVARMKLPAAVVENSPIVALCLSLLAIGAGKYLAFRAAKADLRAESSE